MNILVFTRRIGVALAFACMVLAAPAAFAQSSISGGGGLSVVETYHAFLSARDHYNSNGVRLTQPWQIIRQDRANFHRFGRADEGDQWDSFFASATNRARMESMLRRGSISARAASAIVNREVWVRVQILGHGRTGTAVRVTVQ